MRLCKAMSVTCPCITNIIILHHVPTFWFLYTLYVWLHLRYKWVFTRELYFTKVPQILFVDLIFMKTIKQWKQVA